MCDSRLREHHIQVGIIDVSFPWQASLVVHRTDVTDPNAAPATNGTDASSSSNSTAAVSSTDTAAATAATIALLSVLAGLGTQSKQEFGRECRDLRVSVHRLPPEPMRRYALQDDGDLPNLRQDAQRVLDLPPRPPVLPPDVGLRHRARRLERLTSGRHQPGVLCAESGNQGLSCPFSVSPPFFNPLSRPPVPSTPSILK